MKIIKGNFSVKSNSKEDGMSNDDLYAAMLLNLINPYLSSGKTGQDELEGWLALGIVGWNMAITKATGYPGFQQVLDSTFLSMELSKKDESIVRKIMDAKQRQYPTFMNLIESYDISEVKNGKMHITVVNTPIEDLMSDLEMEDQALGKLQFEEGFINRNALLIKPKPAFWDWFKANDDEFIAPKPPLEYTIYLIPEMDSNNETTKWLKKNYDNIFVNELESWIDDDDYFPKNRNYKMFAEFFELTYHSMVLDLVNEPVVKD